MKPTILIVDDDRLPLAFYVSAIEQQGFEAIHYLEPDSALAFAKKEASRIAAIVLDIMMPPGRKYQRQDTNDGLLTGAFVCEDLRRLCPKAPIVILTNLMDPDTLGRFQEGPLLKIAQKVDYPPLELAQLVTEMVTAAGHVGDAAQREGGPHGE